MINVYQETKQSWYGALWCTSGNGFHKRFHSINFNIHVRRMVEWLATEPAYTSAFNCKMTVRQTEYRGHWYQMLLTNPYIYIYIFNWSDFTSAFSFTFTKQYWLTSFLYVLGWFSVFDWGKLAGPTSSLVGSAIDRKRALVNKLIYGNVQTESFYINIPQGLFLGSPGIFDIEISRSNNFLSPKKMGNIDWVLFLHVKQ